MAGRRPDTATFRADRAGTAAVRPTRRQAVALLVAFVLVAAGAAAAALIVRPDDARTFDLFDGSVLLADAVAPVAVDLASGQPTVRLVDASAQVGAARADDVGVVPTTDGSLLYDRRTGEFNMVDTTGFVLKKNGGVPLPRTSGSSGSNTSNTSDTSAVALAGTDFSYLARTGPAGTSVYVVGASTVQRATGSAPVPPRASGTLPQPLSTTSGSAATAGNDLWVLTGDAGATRTLRHLSLPRNSANGATLRIRTVGTVDGPAAVASSGDTVALASGDGIRLFRGDRVVRTLRPPAVAGTDSVLAATNTSGRFAFLVHGTDGWRVVSVDRDGRDLRGPTGLDGIDSAARLVAPAMSDGALWSADAANGALVRIGLDGAAEPITDAPTYPVVSQGGRSIEAGGFDDVTVYARGPRVVINSPSHLEAVAVFTDGSKRPVSFTKSDAQTINSGGGAEALTRSRNTGAPDRTSDPGGNRTTPRPENPLNNLVDCTTTSQTPHIPVLDTPVPGSRSVQLSWSYPVTDRTDCIPRTYTVAVRLLSSGAPAPPSRVTVDGQLGVDLVGLYPSSRYEIAVTAYLNGKGTASEPIRITTGPQGPTAPTTVTAAPDAGGNWTVGWRSCGTASSRCISAASWRVIPQFCDGLGLTGAPATLGVTADPTSTVQPGAQLVGGSALLGRGVNFRVEGIGANGAVGAPSASTACTRTWSPPDTGVLRLTASRPADADAGGTTSTTLSLDLGSDAVRAAGGVGAGVTFVLDGPGGTQTRTATVDGRASMLTQTFTGIRPGGSYQASAIVSPPGHPDAARTVTADSITPRAQWPALGLAAKCAKTSDTTCTLSVQIGGINSDTSGGERLGLADGSSLRCGDANLPLTTGDFDQSSWTITKQGVSQVALFYGSCTVTVALVETGDNGSTPYFGGIASASASTSVDLGAPATTGAQSGDFTAEWSTQNGTSAKVDYTGQAQLALATGWTSTLYAPDDTSCGADTNAPDPTYVPANSCVQTYGTRTTGWYVKITYSDVVGGVKHTATAALPDGPPPGYRACTPTGFDAAWGATRGAGVTIDSQGGELSGCTGLHYVLTSSAGTECGTADGAPPQTVTVMCGDPADTAWHVEITWTAPDGSPGKADAPVSGDPPAV